MRTDASATWEWMWRRWRKGRRAKEGWAAETCAVEEGSSCGSASHCQTASDGGWKRTERERRTTTVRTTWTKMGMTGETGQVDWDTPRVWSATEVATDRRLSAGAGTAERARPLKEATEASRGGEADGATERGVECTDEAGTREAVAVTVRAAADDRQRCCPPCRPVAGGVWLRPRRQCLVAPMPSYPHRCVCQWSVGPSPPAAASKRLRASDDRRMWRLTLDSGEA